MGEYSIIEILGGSFFLVIAVLFIFLMIFGTDSSDRAHWDNMIKFAIKNNASNLLIEVGKPIHMKIDNNLTPFNMPLVDLKEINHLKSFLKSQPDTWIIPGVGMANVIRNESLAIEFELQPGQHY